MIFNGAGGRDDFSFISKVSFYDGQQSVSARVWFICKLGFWWLSRSLHLLYTALRIVVAFDTHRSSSVHVYVKCIISRSRCSSVKDTARERTPNNTKNGAVDGYVRWFAENYLILLVSVFLNPRHRYSPIKGTKYTTYFFTLIFCVLWTCTFIVRNSDNRDRQIPIWGHRDFIHKSLACVGP